MNTRLLIPILLAGAVALACGSFTRSDASAAPNKSATRHAKVHRDTGAVAIAPELTVNATGGAVQLQLAIANTSRRDVEVAFPDGQQYDFALVNSAGQEVWRWGKGRLFTQARQNRNLAGGDTMRIEEIASAELPRGRYVAVATLRSSNYPVQQRVPFELR